MFIEDPFEETHNPRASAFGIDPLADPFASSSNYNKTNDAEFADFGKFGMFNN